MALILPVEDKFPKWGERCFIAPNATIVGDVLMGDECSVWFNAVIRGDVNSIRIGNKVNIQDGAVIHCTFQKTQALIGNEVSIGHNAIVHGCTVHDHVLIGMGQTAEQTRSAVRFGTSRFTTEHEIDSVIPKIIAAVERLRAQAETLAPANLLIGGRV